MFLLLALACTGPTSDDTFAPAPVAAPDVEYYVWDYTCIGGFEAPEFRPPDREPLFATHLIADEGEGEDLTAWRFSDNVEWADNSDRSANYASTCRDNMRGRITIAYRADE
jgi:hypothetical protein